MQELFTKPMADVSHKNGTDSLRELDSRIVVKGRAIKVARIKGEWCLDVDDPELIVQQLKSTRPVPDIFSFWQRLPQTEPRHRYFMEWDNVTAIPITSYEEWWTKRADRRSVTKSVRKGIETRIVPFGPELLEGIAEIFNEEPVRQGKPMRHYGKTPEMLRHEYLPEIGRSIFLGAFLNGRIVGFAMLVHGGSYLYVAQLMSKKEHWDKGPNNALIAKSVEICAERNIPYFVYTKFYKYQGVTEFKRRNGFERIDLPRYFIPLTWKGKLALRLGLHGGVKRLVPDFIVGWLFALRSKWYAFRYPSKRPARS